MIDYVELSDGCRVPASDKFQTSMATSRDTLLYDTEFLTRIGDYIHPGDLVIDGGACIGSYSRIFSQLVGESGTVIALEPCEENFEFLAHNVSVFPIKNVFIKFCAIAHRQAFGKRSYKPENVGESHIDLKNDGSSIDVEFLTIDQLIPTVKSQPVTFIKLDIEGWEFFALIGAWSIIKRDRPTMFIEVNPVCMKSLGVSYEMLIETLRSLRYSWRMWESPDTVPDQGVFNLLCVPLP